MYTMPIAHKPYVSHESFETLCARKASFGNLQDAGSINDVACSELGPPKMASMILLTSGMID